MAKGKKKKRSVKLEINSKDVICISLIATLMIAPLVIFIISVLNMDRYSFVNVEFFPLWYVALALGVVAGFVFVIKLVGKEQGIWAKIGAFAIIAGITWLGSGSVIAHLNHWFDTSEPVRYEVVIEDRDRINRRKSRDRYEFTFTVNGDTFDVDVPWSDYRNYKEGDTYVVEYHEGAFGEPYFMSVGWSKYLPELPPPAQEPIEE
jgi:hypothetical protein